MSTENNITTPRLVSGTAYCLRELFSGDNDKIVIPDLQRDYCWGGSSNDLVGKFVDTILNLNRTEEITMGLIYGYVNKDLTVEHVQLCDGQQRLTTLFLLMGEINRLTNNSFANLLMSSFEELEDDQEPYLQYSIRESSLYFLSDFTKRYFLSNGFSVNEVEQQPWFLKSYEQDPTILSILAAVKCISSKLYGKTIEDIISLGEFVSSKLKFLYYDMGDRKNGEETFVVINTTGEPLTANQNMKPLFISKNKGLIDGRNSDVIWEEMETWFWRNRNRNAKTPHTSDEGMTAFLQCALLLHAFEDADSDNQSFNIQEDDASEEALRKLSGRYPEFSKYYDLLTNPAKKQEGLAINYSSIPLDILWEIFNAYKRIYSLDYSSRLDDNIRYDVASQTACGYTQRQLYFILPTLEYCYSRPSAGEEDIKRIVHIFHTISRYRDLSRPLTPTIRSLISISEMEDSDPLCLRNVQDFKRNSEECAKLEIIANEPSRRKEVELLFAKAEAHDIFAEAKDSIQILLTWANNDYDEFAKYFDRFGRLWTVRNWTSLDGNLDELRRALLAFQLSGFPIKGEKLCSDKKEWYNVISNNRERIKEFLDIVFDESSPKTLDEIIQEALTSEETNLSLSMKTFIADKSLIHFCEQKKVHNEPHCLEVLRSIRRYDYKIIYNGLVYETKISSNESLRRYTDTILYVDFYKYNLTVDFIYDDNEGYRILVWSGKNKSAKEFDFFDDMVAIGFEPFEKGDKGLSLPLITGHQEAHDKLYEILYWIEERL